MKIWTFLYFGVMYQCVQTSEGSVSDFVSGSISGVSSVSKKQEDVKEGRPAIQKQEGVKEGRPAIVVDEKDEDHGSVFVGQGTSPVEDPAEFLLRDLQNSPHGSMKTASSEEDRDGFK